VSGYSQVVVVPNWTPAQVPALRLLEVIVVGITVPEAAPIFKITNCFPGRFDSW
jgi:hypothetical protein